MGDSLWKVLGVVLGLLLSILLAPIVGSIVWMAVVSGDGRAFTFSRFSGVFTASYLLTIGFSPFILVALTLIHVCLSRVNWTKWWAYAAMGALVAGAPFLYGVLTYSSPSLQEDWTEVRQRLTIPATAAIVSVVFWGVAVWMSPAETSRRHE